jgi:hypothetical protein
LLNGIKGGLIGILSRFVQNKGYKRAKSQYLNLGEYGTFKNLFLYTLKSQEKEEQKIKLPKE